MNKWDDKTNRTHEMKFNYKGMNIELTKDGTYRPDGLIINNDLCTMSAFYMAHGYNWESKSTGNYLYYRSEDGKEYCIPQKVLSRYYYAWKAEQEAKVAEVESRPQSSRRSDRR